MKTPPYLWPAGGTLCPSPVQKYRSKPKSGFLFRFKTSSVELLMSGQASFTHFVISFSSGSLFALEQQDSFLDRLQTLAAAQSQRQSCRATSQSRLSSENAIETVQKALRCQPGVPHGGQNSDALVLITAFFCNCGRDSDTERKPGPDCEASRH